jgi:hypothetical protein
MGDEPKKSQSWWQTVPGILSRLAALIVALTGLYAAYHQSQNQQTATKSSTELPSPNPPQISPSSTLSPSTVPSPPVSPSSDPLPKPIDLSGKWSALGYMCPANVVIP